MQYTLFAKKERCLALSKVAAAHLLSALAGAIGCAAVFAPSNLSMAFLAGAAAIPFLAAVFLRVSKSVSGGGHSNGHDEHPVVSEARYRSLYECSMDAVLLAQSDGRVTVSANPAACALFGMSEEELRRVGRAGIIDESDPAFQDLLETRRRNGQARGEVRARRADGTEFFADATSVAFRDERGEECTSIILRDTTQRRYAEEKLRTGERLTQMMSRLARVGGWEADLQARRVLWSDEVRRIHGVPPDYPGPRIDEGIGYYAPEYRARIETVFDACIRDGVPFDEELQIINAGGERVWIRTIGQPVHGADGAVASVQGAFQDINDRKLAERELFKSRQRFHQFADAMPVIVWTAEPDGAVDYANRAFINYTGINNDELPGERWINAVHPEDREGCLAAWRESVLTEKPYSTEFRIMRAGSRTDRWHMVRAVPVRDDHGQLVKWYGTAIDIHARKRAEKVIRRLADSLRTTLESITDAFFTLDRDWRFTYVNRQAEHLLKRKRSELLGKVIWREFPELVGTAFEHAYRRAVTDANTVKLEAFHAPLEAWLDATAYPSAQGLAVYFRDVSERKRLATEREGLEEQLRQSQRLEAVGQLTGGVAHDFNNLLTVILGAADVLAERLSDDSHAHELAELVKSTAERGANLTHRLLAFGRRQALAPQAVDVRQLVTGMNGLLERTLSGNIRLDVMNAQGLWKAFVDAAELEAALLNLCINARDAMNGRGRLVIETSNVLLDGDAADAGDAKPGEYVLIAVSDTGEGIPKDVLERVFDPFFTTKEKGKGTGLGLSMVYGFIKQSQGHVNIESEPGRGTTVRLYLPRAADVGAVVLDRGEETSGLHGFEKILIVEDDDTVRRQAHAVLRDLGYYVVMATNGMEAIELLRKMPDIDLLFTDVIMRDGMNGRELAEAALLLNPALGILYTSGYTEDVDISQGQRTGEVQFLPKPYRKADLGLKIREVLACRSARAKQEGKRSA